MIAEVIPYKRTPRGRDFFDYRIPEDMDIAIGDTVLIPFRKQTIPGVVRAIKEQSAAKRLRSISGMHHQQYWNSRVPLLEQFAEHYYCSLPTAYYTIQHEYTAKPSKEGVAEVRESAVAPKEHVPSTSEEPAKHLIRVNEPSIISSEIRKLWNEKSASQKPTFFVLVPEYQRGLQIASQLNDLPIRVYKKEPTKTVWRDLQNELRTESLILIGTRSFAGIDSQVFDAIIIDSEESKLHTQFSKNPRYDAVTLLEMQKGPDLYAYSVAPSGRRYALDVWKYSEELGEWNQDITIVDMEDNRQRGNYSWCSEQAKQAIQNAQSTLVFQNRTGEQQRLICSDCSTMQEITQANCISCNGTNLKQILLGTIQREDQLRELFPNHHIERIDRTIDEEEINHKRQAANTTGQSITVATEKVLRTHNLQDFDAIVILGIDSALLYPHVLTQERVFQLLTNICAAQRPTIIQTNTPDHPTLRAVLHNQYRRFIRSELALRKQLHAPPYQPWFRISNSTNRDVQRMHQGHLDPKTLAEDDIVERL